VEHSSVLNYCMALERGQCSGGLTPPFGAADVARASRPLSRERPAPASRGQDAHATSGGRPALQQPGYHVTYLPVDREGLLNLADLEAAITDETAVVSLIWANNGSRSVPADDQVVD
jgi:hypothetical protein